jgi:chloramphenicol-sensitive protein RarD
MAKAVRESARGARIGTAAAFAAYGLWGLFPLYWKRLAGVESLQILCHRIVWAAVFTAAGLLALRRGGELVALARNPRRLGFAAAASALIAVNWGTYIWAVNSGHVAESSLGYYINPLVSVACGAIFFRERMDKWTAAALAIAASGVAAASLLLGAVPWISLALAASFGLYGLVKKRAGLEPLVGLAAETLIAAPFALAFLLARRAAGQGAFGGADAAATALLFLAGLVTAIPLLLFAAAANRLTLTRLGFIQYLSPSLQLALGVFVFGERVQPPLAVAFASVILAVGLYFLTRSRAKA